MTSHSCDVMCRAMIMSWRLSIHLPSKKNSRIISRRQAVIRLSVNDCMPMSNVFKTMMLADDWEILLFGCLAKLACVYRMHITDPRSRSVCSIFCLHFIWPNVSASFSTVKTIEKLFTWIIESPSIRCGRHTASTVETLANRCLCVCACVSFVSLFYCPVYSPVLSPHNLYL